MNTIPQNFSPVYLCPLCGAGYFSEGEAVACRNSAPVPAAKPGDMLLLQLGHSWYDGDPAWVIENGGYIFHHPPNTHAFWFVVTSVDTPRVMRPLYGEPDAHQWRYTVVSKAMKGLIAGAWTRPLTHYWQWEDEKREPPEAVRLEAQQFIGIKSDTLL